MNGTGYFDVQQEVASDSIYVNSVFVNGQLYAAADDRIVVRSDFGPSGKANQVLFRNGPRTVVARDQISRHVVAHCGTGATRCSPSRGAGRGGGYDGSS